VFKGSYRSHPQVVTASPADHPISIVLADCLDTTNFRTYDASSGKLTDNTRGGRRATGATVRRVDEVWKVISFGVREKGTC
jgi:hypothetical protein